MCHRPHRARRRRGRVGYLRDSGQLVRGRPAPCGPVSGRVRRNGPFGERPPGEQRQPEWRAVHRPSSVERGGQWGVGRHVGRPGEPIVRLDVSRRQLPVRSSTGNTGSGTLVTASAPVDSSTGSSTASGGSSGSTLVDASVPIRSSTGDTGSGTLVTASAPVDSSTGSSTASGGSSGSSGSTLVNASAPVHSTPGSTGSGTLVNASAPVDSPSAGVGHEASPCPGPRG